jgi:hypothetical protein
MLTSDSGEIEVYRFDPDEVLHSPTYCFVEEKTGPEVHLCFFNVPGLRL